MADYAWAVELARTLITDFGGQCVLLRPPTDGNPEPWDAPSDVPSSEHPSMGVLLDYTIEDAGKMKAAGETYEVGDKQCYLEAADLGTIEPRTSDLLRDPAGTTWRIRNVKKLAPDGVSNILFELHLGV